MVRPTKFTPEIGEVICLLHSEGLTQTQIAKYLNITRQTIYNWVQKGKRSKYGKYREFYLDWVKAGANYERVHLEAIQSSDDWEAHQYLLQVANPNEYVVTKKSRIIKSKE